MNKDRKFLKITKLDAAKRQLDIAVRLWFHDGDPVSIHTLAEAAHEVLSGIRKHRGLEPLLLSPEGFTPHIKEGFEKLAVQKLKAAKIFFKHADRDPEGTVDFCPATNDLILFEGANSYCQLTGEHVPAFGLMIYWYIRENPEHFTLPDEVTKSFEGSNRFESKTAFYDESMAEYARRW